MEYNDLKQALIDENSSASQDLLNVLSYLVFDKLVFSSYSSFELIREEYGIDGFSVYLNHSLNSSDFRDLLSTRKFFTIHCNSDGVLVLTIRV